MRLRFTLLLLVAALLATSCGTTAPPGPAVTETAGAPAPATLQAGYPAPGAPGTATPQPPDEPSGPPAYPAPGETASPEAPSASPTATPVPMATATPLATWPAIAVTPPPGATIVPGQGPQIVFLQSNVLYAAPGQDVTLEWESSGGQAATLYTAGPQGQLGAVLATTAGGTISYTVPVDALDAQRFALFVTDAAGYTSQATLAVRVPCPAIWFFAAGAGECPGGNAVVSNGAEQHFDGGTMLWNEHDKRIYVLYNDPAQGYFAGPQWAAYPDEWTEGMPETDETIEPPVGRKQPRRGFGLVWRTYPEVRQGLGWATDSESGYSQSVQITARRIHNWTYIAARHDGTWALGPDGGAWHYVP